MTTAAATFTGHYPIASRIGEIERLHVQSAALAPETDRLLDAIGVAGGWRCVDLGCGPGGITTALQRRVGPGGYVLGVDMNEDFLHAAREAAPAGVEFRRADVYATGLPSASFDLVHLRFVASTVGQPERLLAEARRLARPGGVVALQEPDGSTLNCEPPHPAWERLKSVFLRAFASVGADVELARRLYGVVRRAGLADVQVRTSLLSVRTQDRMVDYLPSTVESLRQAIVDAGLMSDAELTQTLAECRRHLRQPETVFTMYTVAQVWGREP